MWRSSAGVGVANGDRGDEGDPLFGAEAERKGRQVRRAENREGTTTHSSSNLNEDEGEINKKEIIKTEPLDALMTSFFRDIVISGGRGRMSSEGTTE